MAMEASSRDESMTEFAQVKFSHVQLYVSRLDSLAAYKTVEQNLQEFSKRLDSHQEMGLDEMRQLWQSITHTNGFEMEFLPQNRDIIKQMLTGFGMRVTGVHHGSGTRSFLVTTKDLGGVQVVVTAKNDSEVETSTEGQEFQHFQAANIDRFFESQKGRQGIAVLGFHVDDVKAVHSRYKNLHPKLIHFYAENRKTKILEVFAYYTSEDIHSTEDAERQPDAGTMLRFVETEKAFGGYCVLPGLLRVPASFDDSSQSAYFDHWVSNVYSRTEFLDTLNDTLGFEPKVDFNAGVVAAGEAQIESTVTGNESTLQTSDKAVTLQDQSQVYLPINNALSSVGHVHGFLEEIGQGIQHI
ncbi:MAG: hypothetical protein SGILL_009119, partial [Bacillariaceae sp.]